MRGRKNGGDRKERRENVSVRSLRVPRFVLAVVSLWPSLADAQPHLTFTKDIAPIVWSRCASCHRPGEIGPFSLNTYEDVRRHAAQIAPVTPRRIIPPRKPDEGKGK